MRMVFVLSGKYRSAKELLPFLEPSQRSEDVYADIHEVLEEI